MIYDYDQWLEAPYRHEAQAQEQFEDWCEAHGVNPADPEAELLFSDWQADWSEPEPDLDEYEDEERYDDVY